MRSLALLSSYVLVSLTACQGDSGGFRKEGSWDGVVRDSAGVRVVQNPESGIWTEESRWTVEEDLSIGLLDGPTAYQFGQVTDVDVGEDGTIYVVDYLFETIRAFNGDGTFRFAFGVMGDGPGEFTPGGMPTQLLVRPGGELWVPDIESRRAHRFGADGSWISTVPLSFWATGQRWFNHAAGGFIHSPRGDDPSWAG